MTLWSKEQVERILQEQGWLTSQREIQDGVQYSLLRGVRVNWYKTGKVVVSGTVSDLRLRAQEIFSSEPSQTAAATVQTTPGAVEPAPKRVFIVYGHDATAREQLELILHRLNLDPIVLRNLPGAGDTLIEKLETLTAADFACVLLTPDDEGHEYAHPDEKQPRARQNVVLELGMVLAKLGRKRVAILVKSNNLERPSDIAGLIYIPFDEHVEEAKNFLGANLQEAGFDIQVKDLL